MTDADIRHVTSADANLFDDLGFAPNEAERLRAAVSRAIASGGRLSFEDAMTKQFLEDDEVLRRPADS